MAVVSGAQGAAISNGPAAEAAILASKLQTFQSMVETKDRALIGELWSEGGFHLVGSERGEICLTREQVEASWRRYFPVPEP